MRVAVSPRHQEVIDWLIQRGVGGSRSDIVEAAVELLAGGRLMKFEDLEGKTIQSAQKMHLINTDDTGFLVLTMTDGTVATIVGGSTEEFTENSHGEYPTVIEIFEGRRQDLIPF